jgi:hypothetical protein
MVLSATRKKTITRFNIPAIRTEMSIGTKLLAQPSRRLIRNQLAQTKRV